MKNYIRTTIIAALLVGLTAAPAHADDEALAAFGGFVVGMITGAVIENNSDHHHVAVEISSGHRDYRAPRCGKHGRYSCNSCSSRHHGPKGYWKTTRHKVWVPGHWSIVINDCGDRVRVWSRGHYTYQTKRIWIEHPHRGYSRSRCG